MVNEFDNYNGFLVEKGEKFFNTSNRGFKYGDGIFETIKVANGEIMFWDFHYQRLLEGFKCLKLDHEKFDSEFFKSQIEKLIFKNFYRDVKFRVFVFRDAPGLYTPMGNRLAYLIEGVRLDNPNFSFKKEGINLGIYKDSFKSLDVFKNCKTISALLYVMASIYKKENHFDDVVVLNSTFNVCESSVANIFTVKDGVVFTPSLSEGPVMGVMRNVVLGLLKDLGYKVEEGKITIEQMMEADEVFLTNTLMGAQGVKNIGEHTKNQEVVRKLQSELQKLV